VKAWTRTLLSRNSLGIDLTGCWPPGDQTSTQEGVSCETPNTRERMLAASVARDAERPVVRGIDLNLVILFQLQCLDN